MRLSRSQIHNCKRLPVLRWPHLAQTSYQTSYQARLGLVLTFVFAFLLAIAGCSSSLPNSYEATLADHLTDSGAKMYGAYWCPHCANQKDYFGGAAHRIPYIECDIEGRDSQASLCAEANITAYPTWVIEGEYYLGAQPLGKLARLSRFEGAVPTDKDFNSSSGAVSPSHISPTP